MYNLPIIEEAYKKFIQNLPFWLPEGICFIDLKLLHDLNLLNFRPLGGHKKELKLNSLFNVIESFEKIILVNEEFIVWITPYFLEEQTSTTILIALNRGDEMPQLEMGFVGSGVYNQSKLILQVLEKFLIEIQETEYLLARFKNI